MNGFFVRLYGLVVASTLVVFVGTLLLVGTGALPEHNEDLHQLVAAPLSKAAARLDRGEAGVLEELSQATGPTLALIPRALLPLDENQRARLEAGEVVIEGNDFRRWAYAWVPSRDAALEFEILGAHNQVLQWVALAQGHALAGETVAAPSDPLTRTRLAQRPVALSISSWKPATRVLFSTAQGVRQVELHARSRRFARWTGLATLLVVSALAVLLPVLPLQRQLAALERTAKQLGAGDLDARVPLHRGSGPAAHAVAEQFNRMAQRVEDTLHENEQLLRSVAHEMRTPISRLLLALDLVEDDKPEARVARVSDMRGTVSEMQALTQELLEFARLDERWGELDRRPSDLRELLEEAVCRWEGTTLDAAERAAPLELDERLVLRAVDNAIANAVRYASAPVVRLVELDDRYLVQVDDDGPGIAAEDAERVFEPFVRLEHSRSRATGGTGLGLAILRRIVQAHGGDAHIEPSPLGGTRVQMWLPRGPR